MLNVGAPWLQSPANVAANVGWHQCWKGRSKGRGIEKIGCAERAKPSRNRVLGRGQSGERKLGGTRGARAGRGRP